MGVLALLWGSTFLWIELALDGLSPAQVTLVRCALGAATLTVLLLLTRNRLPRGRAMWKHIFIAAFFCNALPFGLFSVGQQTVDSGVAGALNATTPLWSVLIGLAIGTERGLRPVRLAGLLVGFAGTSLIFAPWEQSGMTSWGALAIVGAAASYAVGFAYMGHHLVGKGVPTLSLSAAQLMAATVLTAPALPAGGAQPLQVTPTTLIAIAVLGIFATGVTFHLTYRIIADEGATNAATVGYLLPVVSVALGAIVLDEAFSFRVAAGMAVVLIGVSMTRRQKRTSAALPERTPSVQPKRTPSAPPKETPAASTRPAGAGLRWVDSPHD
ncbi:DMT family transporter [Streptomyces sp. Je 1-332]|uniref:DMT family transporter n=1 Tax=Streptomyces sp. Je 1-332 TaxID=3231270 RepID=UPI003458C7C9